MTLNQPYYIEKRKNESHISLDLGWELCYTDAPTDSISSLNYDIKTDLPSSLFHSLHKAGIMPDPYYGTNSKEFHWVDEKVWYYRKKFTLNNPAFDGNAFLCFDGVAYYSRLWVNGVLLGDHEGMYGGPCCDIYEYLDLNGENEITVEVKACNFGQKEGYYSRFYVGELREIVPWNIIRDNSTSNGDFIVLGIWNSVRLELLPKIHLSRPYMYTESIDDDTANICFEVEISDGSLKELHKYHGIDNSRWACYTYTRAYDKGNTGAVLDSSVDIKISLSDGEKIAYECSENVPLTDFLSLGMNEQYFELQFYRKSIELKNPKLWYPNGMGEAFLYDVKVTLSFEGKVLDTQDFKFGVRTFRADYTRGNKYRHRWDKFLFSVNGKEFFLKGMNWMPIDYLYDISPDRYEWVLTLVKNSGIQLLRIWNGGGMPESDSFYEICDRLGILVWQDLFIANTTKTHNYPQDILEEQMAYNLYRIRNHPSLAILCGGNEFNPYSQDNAANMFVMQRAVDALAPDRIFYYTTADKGSAHIYIDMEPVWYRHRYKQLPFLGESGIHSFPSYKTIKKLISHDEATGKLPDLSAPEFAENYPNLLNHFTEYIPSRVPRMTSRISQIIDMKDITLEDICEAAQVQAYEFYQLMIQSMQENYPVCGGLMPWVFKRHWTTVGIQMVDGDDRPGYQYYSVQNSYRPINIAWLQEWSVLAPGETVGLKVKVFNQNGEDLRNAVITLSIFNPDMTIIKEYTGEYSEFCDFGKFTLDESMTDTCFLVSADISKDGKLLARSVYFNKCTSKLSDKDLYDTYRKEPKENLRLDDGPWLKPTIQSAKQAKLDAKIISRGTEGKYSYAEILIKNISDIPAYPITLDTADDDSRCFLSESFFMMKPHEEKTVRITSDKEEIGSVKIDLWNGENITVN